jgi:hypothetical protein
MSTDKPWSHLPNAKHIDAVLEDVKARPEAWDNAIEKSWRDWRHKTRVAARKYARKLAMSTHTTTARGMAWTEVWVSTRKILNNTPPDTVAALIAWDSSADLLECTPDVLRTMIDLGEPPVCHQAALLLPYAIVRSNAKQEVT